MKFKVENDFWFVRSVETDDFHRIDDDGEWVDITERLEWDYSSQLKLLDLVATHFVPFAKSALKLPKFFQKFDHSEGYIFFGGSFNPWHMGHRVTLDLCPSGPIIVVPDQNPWKEVHNRSSPWSFYLDLCSKLKDTPYSVYPGFLNLNQPNPTIDWIKQIDPPKKSLLMGEDSFVKILKWKNASELLKMLHCIFISPRHVESSPIAEIMKSVKEIAPQLKLEYLDHHDFEDISSSELRKK